MSHTSREPPLCYAKLEFSRVCIILNDKPSRIESLSLIPDLCALLCITPPIRLSRASNSICMPIFRVISYASIDLIRSCALRCIALRSFSAFSLLSVFIPIVSILTHSYTTLSRVQLCSSLHCWLPPLPFALLPLPLEFSLIWVYAANS